MVDFRADIRRAMKRDGVTLYDLVQRLKGKVAERALYAYLAPDSKSETTSKTLRHIFDALHLYVAQASGEQQLMPPGRKRVS